MLRDLDLDLMQNEDWPWVATSLNDSRALQEEKGGGDYLSEEQTTRIAPPPKPCQEKVVIGC